MSSTTYSISGIQGNVWLHQDKTTQLINGEGHTISFGDAIVTAPLAKATIELSSNQHIHIGNRNKEVLVLDHAVHDNIYDVNEVTIELASLNTLSTLSIASIFDHDISHDIFSKELNFSFFGHNEDSALNYNSIEQHELSLPSHIEVRDVISDFNPITDRYSLPHSSFIALGSNQFIEAQNKVQISNLAIAFHKIDDHGYISFKDTHGYDIHLNESNMLCSVVDYLAKNFDGRVGDTFMFRIANDSYIFHFHPEIYAQQFGITKFEGLTFDGLSQSHDANFGNYLYVDFS